MLKTLQFFCFQRAFQPVCIARHFSYKSEISPEVLYPNSRQKLFTPDPPLPVSCTEKQTTLLYWFIEYYLKFSKYMFQYL